MIILTRLNGSRFALNSDLIETIEENPDTTIRLVNRSMYIVHESMNEVIQLLTEFRKQAAGYSTVVVPEKSGEGQR